MNKSVARIKHYSQLFLEGNLYSSHLLEIGGDEHCQLLILYLKGSLAAAAILLYYKEADRTTWLNSTSGS